MRYLYCSAPLFFLILNACTQPVAKRGNSMQQSELDIDASLTAYDWVLPLNELNGRKLEVSGFVWFDTADPALPRGVYRLYPTPNCHNCPHVDVLVENSVPIHDKAPTEPLPLPQWRLVKATGTVARHRFLVADRFDRSTVSYPDYEKAGYRKVDAASINEFHNNAPVFIDGRLTVESLSFSVDYVSLGIEGTTLPHDIAVYVRKGKHANEAEPLPERYTQTDLKVRDWHGKLIGKKRVRLYGTWSDYLDEGVGPGMIHVEAIVPL